MQGVPRATDAYIKPSGFRTYRIRLPRTRTRQRDTVLAVNVRNSDLRGFAVIEIMGPSFGDCERTFATPFGKYISRCHQLVNAEADAAGWRRSERAPEL